MQTTKAKKAIHWTKTNRKAFSHYTEATQAAKAKYNLTDEEADVVNYNLRNTWHPSDNSLNRNLSLGLLRIQWSPAPVKAFLATMEAQAKEVAV